MELLEKILEDKNLFNAYKQVYNNKGTSGIDGITVDELGYYMYKNKEEIKEQIRNLKYKPNPIRRVEIPKENGKMRKLGISEYNAYMVANTRRGYYWVVSTVVLHMAISNKRLQEKGLVFPLDHYLKVHTII